MAILNVVLPSVAASVAALVAWALATRRAPQPRALRVRVRKR